MNAQGGSYTDNTLSYLISIVLLITRESITYFMLFYEIWFVLQF